MNDGFSTTYMFSKVNNLDLNKNKRIFYYLNEKKLDYHETSEGHRHLESG